MCDSKNPSVNDKYDALCRSLSENSCIKIISQQFGALQTNFERVDFVYDLIKQYKLCAEFKESCKSNEESIRWRQEGNKRFKNREDQLALEYYTKSIGWAERDSENLGLAYANRSAVLFEKKLYEECLVDIERALANDYPQNLHGKLLLRKEKANALRQQIQKQIYNEIPTVSSHPNRFIECATDSIEIKYEDNIGRHVIATKDIEVGEILAVDEPYAQILLPENYLTHCHNCLGSCYTLIPCDVCCLVFYCAEDCKSTAWNTYHRHECSILSSLLNLKVNKLTLLALRICIRAKGEYENVRKFNKTAQVATNSSYKSGNYEEIHNLISNTHLRSVADLFERATKAAIIYDLVKNKTGFFNSVNDLEANDTFKELLLLHMQTGPSNFHEVSELVRLNNKLCETCEIGAGAYSFLSLLNHSCSPNVVRHCYKSFIVLRALRPIKLGQQLYDNYGYHHAIMSKSERQEHLRTQYYFDCSCEACLENWPLYSELPLRNIEIDVCEDDLLPLRKGDVEVASKLYPNLLATAGELDHYFPCKEVADLQEIIKQCYAIHANKRNVL